MRNMHSEVVKSLKVTYNQSEPASFIDIANSIREDGEDVVAISEADQWIGSQESMISAESTGSASVYSTISYSARSSKQSRNKE